jgi:hypothetical protein
MRQRRKVKGVLMSIKNDGCALGYRAIGLFAAAEYLAINDGCEILPALCAEQITSPLDCGYSCFQIIDPAGDVVMQTARWQTLVEKMEAIEDFANGRKKSVADVLTIAELNRLFNLEVLGVKPGADDFVAVPRARLK